MTAIQKEKITWASTDKVREKTCKGQVSWFQGLTPNWARRTFCKQIKFIRKIKINLIIS